jgi:hypothetical protein
MVGEDVAADTVVKELQGRGVEVELRYERNPRLMMNIKNMTSTGTGDVGGDAESGIVDPTTGLTVPSSAATVGSLESYAADSLDPMTLFNNFMNSSVVSSMLADSVNKVNESSSSSSAKTKATKGAATAHDIDGIDVSGMYSNKAALHDAVLLEGRATLERLLGVATVTEGGLSKEFASKNKICNLRFDKIKLTNFGPYGAEPVQYPLSNRGLVLIRGKSSDRTGADSNGSGKV